jgi:hypothetical protein
VKTRPKTSGALLLSEGLAGELHGRWDGGNPVQSVKDGEERQAVEREGAHWQEEEGEAAQSVMPGQELAAVIPVRQPAGGNGADEVERSHEGEDGGGLHLLHPEIGAEWD